jgi:hypothetical protein
MVVTLACLCGCGDSSPANALQTASAMKAKSLLKEYQVAQNVFRMESEGRYGTIGELAQRGHIKDELANASDKKQALAVNGYLFADIEQDSAGQPLERHAKAGVCAYPQDGNGPVILMLLDTNDPEEWAFYAADSAATGGAVRRWPGAEELKSKFARGGKYTPQQAMKEAEKLAK